MATAKQKQREKQAMSKGLQNVLVFLIVFAISLIRLPYLFVRDWREWWQVISKNLVEMNGEKEK